MDSNDLGRSPDGSGSRASHEAASSTASSPEASIPNAAFGGSNGWYGGDPAGAAAHYAKWPANTPFPVLTASPSRMTTGVSFTASISATDQYQRIVDYPECLEAPARAIAANKRGKTPNDPEIDKVWRSYVGQAKAGILAFLEGSALRQKQERAASAIEARRAATAETGAVHESAIGNAETPKPSRGTDHG